ncbi:hypothetical protein Smp_001280 [Schistosoma mansoni]|uniref:hypothetical protein n=1 Tax=Schistosoma mansoni TaxID=6183 RepID=UPI0001A63695|nr:hypothetical protein Smp_001280 [Schistosoma mansoni]|eukprot:XP_018650612.1 hypothetical protein Smp_001280 [Schistosoma mansoni]
MSMILGTDHLDNYWHRVLLRIIEIQVDTVVVNENDFDIQDFKKDYQAKYPHVNFNSSIWEAFIMGKAKRTKSKSK